MLGCCPNCTNVGLMNFYTGLVLDISQLGQFSDYFLLWAYLVCFLSFDGSPQCW